jgi:hypothetical protein
MMEEAQEIVSPVLYYDPNDGSTIVCERYGVHSVTGDIYVEHRKTWCKLAPKMPTPRKLKMSGEERRRKTNYRKVKYPYVTIYNSVKVDHDGKEIEHVMRKKIRIHRAVASTLIERPDIYSSFSEREWEGLSSHTKAKQLGYLQVHHINLDKSDWKPINLEWKTHDEHREIHGR